MRIQTILTMSTLSSLITFSLIILIFAVASLQISEASKNEAATLSLVRGMTGLEILTYDYLRHKEKRTKRQWQTIH